jgi:hypothetical protein
MQSRFVEDGEERLQESKGYRDRLRVLRNDIRSSHAAQLAGAGPVRRVILYWRMLVEYRRERQRLLPSPNSLYSTENVADAPQRPNKDSQ